MQVEVLSNRHLNLDVRPNLPDVIFGNPRGAPRQVQSQLAGRAAQPKLRPARTDESPLPHELEASVPKRFH